MTQAALFDMGSHWHATTRSDPRARWLADRHYSRQTPGAKDFMSSGKLLVLVTQDALAVWGVIENMDPLGKLHWRCSIFRNESPVRSSDLIREATLLTFEYWTKHYYGCPEVPLRTEVDPRKVRRKRDPGRCFLKAGWWRVKEHRGLIVLEAPDIRWLA